MSETLPPLPKPDTHCFDEDTGKDVWSHSPEQMQAYATAATEPLLQRIAELERQLEQARKDAERWDHACKGNNKNINVCAWDADSYEFVGYAMKKEAVDAIADAEIAAMQKGQS